MGGRMEWGMANSRKGKRKNINGGLVIALVASSMLIVIILSIASAVQGTDTLRRRIGGSGGTSSGVVSQGNVSGETVTETTEDYLCVLLSVDDEAKMLNVYDVYEEKQKSFYYVGGTYFYSDFGTVIAPTQLEYGSMLDMTYQPEKDRVSSVKVSDSIWEKDNIEKFTIDTNRKMITIGENNYRYTDGLCIISGDRLTSVDNLLPTDKLCVRGVGDTIREIVVLKGHGYVTLVNDDDFIGGIIDIGSGIQKTIEENASYLVREGTYTLRVRKGSYDGTKEITVTRDRVTAVDVFEYGRGVVYTGTVDIGIKPYGAQLYIDGKETDYNSDITLEYGTYTIKATLGGYQDYEGKLVISSPGMKLNINLVEIPIGESDSTASSSATGTTSKESSENSDKNSNTTNTYGENNYYVTTDNKMYILTPYGAEVYLDDEYLSAYFYLLGGSDEYVDVSRYKLGTIPESGSGLVVNKLIGDFKLTILNKNGTVDYYDVTTTANGEDVYLSY